MSIIGVYLTSKEHQMLELLGLRQGKTVSKEQFLNHLYGGIEEPEQKIIDVFICKLRKKLSRASGGKHYIETIWGRGYYYVGMRSQRQSPERTAAQLSGICRYVSPSWQ
jgi:two-component system, cell cycle response regulator CtrA